MSTVVIGRAGGLARSPAKTKANRCKAQEFWRQVRAGVRPQPRRGARVYNRDEPRSSRAVDLVRGKIYTGGQLNAMLIRELALSVPEARRLVAGLLRARRISRRATGPQQYIYSDHITMATVVPPESRT